MSYIEHHAHYDNSTGVKTTTKSFQQGDVLYFRLLHHYHHNKSVLTMVHVRTPPKHQPLSISNIILSGYMPAVYIHYTFDTTGTEITLQDVSKVEATTIPW
jgi:hypothetical protein